MYEKRLRKALRYRERWPDVPVREFLDSHIALELRKGGRLVSAEESRSMPREMAGVAPFTLAGWAVEIAGAHELARRIGVRRAARRVYLVSVGIRPSFDAPEREMMYDLLVRASQERQHVMARRRRTQGCDGRIGAVLVG